MQIYLHLNFSPFALYPSLQIPKYSFELISIYKPCNIKFNVCIAIAWISYFLLFDIVIIKDDLRTVKTGGVNLPCFVFFNTGGGDMHP